MEKKLDRRVKKTRKQLQDGFTALLIEKSIKEITVKELCDKVDLNRGTFYLHYKDIYDMAKQMEDELFNHFETVLTNHPSKQLNGEPFPMILDLFVLIKENACFCNALLSNNGDIVFINKLKSILRDKCFNDWIDISTAKKADKFDYLYNFTISGCIGIIEYWLKNGLKESPEEIAQITSDIIVNGAKILQ